MITDTAGLIEQRPHLKEPLALYAKWQEFQRLAAALPPRKGATPPLAGHRAYPPEIASELVNLFAACFSIPVAELSLLGAALSTGEVDFMQLPIGEIATAPQQGMGDEAMSTLLFLFARPYFLALRKEAALGDGEWLEGRCPLCSAHPALASIIEGPKRLLHCSYCATSGSYRFVGCPHCGCVDTDQLGAILSEDEPGFRVVTCNACQSYLKVAEGPILQKMHLDHADLASLPLDLIAQDKGYRRHAPNPIGLLRMT